MQISCVHFRLKNCWGPTHLPSHLILLRTYEAFTHCHRPPSNVSRILLKTKKQNSGTRKTFYDGIILYSEGFSPIPAALDMVLLVLVLQTSVNPLHFFSLPLSSRCPNQKTNPDTRCACMIAGLILLYVSSWDVCMCVVLCV